jgi:hypothetical protein
MVIDMRIALHDKPVRETEVIKERDKAFDRRVGRRIAASGLIGKFVRGAENVRMRIPGAGRRLDARAPRMATGPAMRGGSSVSIESSDRHSTSPWRGEVASEASGRG